MRFTDLNLILYPFVDSVRDPGENSLIIDVYGSYVEEISKEQRRQRLAAARDEAERLFATADQVVRDETALYRVNFEDYVVYQVLNESYDSGYPGPVYRDKKFRIFDDSPFLDFARRTAVFEFAEHFNEGRKPRHYGFWSSGHIVDIISCREPSVEKIKREQAVNLDEERTALPSQVFVKREGEA